MCSGQEGALGAGGGGDTDWNAWQGQNDARDLRSTSFMSSSVNPGPWGRIYALRGPVTSRGCWWCRGVPGHAPELYGCDMSTYIDTLSLIKRPTNGVCCRREQTLRHWDSHRQTRGRRIDGVRERSAVKIFMFCHPKEGLIIKYNNITWRERCKYSLVLSLPVSLTFIFPQILYSSPPPSSIIVIFMYYYTFYHQEERAERVGGW